MKIAWPKDTACELAFNYILVKLDRCIGNEAGWWCAKEYDPSWNLGNYFRKVGYQYDFYNKERPYYTETHGAISGIQTQCTNSDGTESWLMQSNVFCKGNPFGSKSGDPVYAVWEDEPCVIGLSNICDTNKHSILTGGPGMVAMIEKHKYD